MTLEKLADAMDRFTTTIADLAEELRNEADGQDKHFGDDHNERDAADDDLDREVDEQDGPPQAAAPAEETKLQVPAGDLWRLVNRSRKMIRLAREGKIPDQEKLAPLCRAIKALKQKGLVQKPRGNLRDRD